eukprot:gene33850-41759_t
MERSQNSEDWDKSSFEGSLSESESDKTSGNHLSDTEWDTDKFNPSRCINQPGGGGGNRSEKSSQRRERERQERRSEATSQSWGNSAMGKAWQQKSEDVIPMKFITYKQKKETNAERCRLTVWACLPMGRPKSTSSIVPYEYLSSYLY